MTTGCVFCAIAAGHQPSVVVREWDDAVAFVPLAPVVDGHILVIPRAHVVDAAESPLVAGMVAARAAELGARLYGTNFHLVNNVGPLADQTTFHLHWHLCPRQKGDGLVMPWTAQQQQVVVGADGAGRSHP